MDTMHNDSVRTKWPTEDVNGPFRDDCDFHDKDLRFLSNFHEAPVDIWSHYFRTAEHAYQAAKADMQLFEKIKWAPSPGKAKRLGRQADLPPDWDVIKTGIMAEVVTAKFTQNRDLAGRLNRLEGPIVELNWWGDTFWGADINTGEGKNVLGRILMGVREMPLELLE